MKDNLSKHVAGFQKSQVTQHSLIIMLGKWQSALEKGDNIFNKRIITLKTDKLSEKGTCWCFSGIH